VEGLGELGYPARADEVDALLSLAELLERWSHRINLTGHRSLDAIVRNLILEAAALAGEIPPVASLADLGSGAGFPGLPIAVLRPGCEVSLIEARERRHHFQRAALRELDLQNVRLEWGRAETLDARPHAAVVAQAIASPERALPWMVRWAAPGALLLLPGSHPPPEIPEITGVSFEQRRRYRLPCGGPERTLWMARRLV
jgi:16S rRNA (guanine527-N7)-methyltransferase